MKLLSIDLTNFGVFKGTITLDFTKYDENEKILIVGENRDEAGADSNGSGKTTFLNGISWILFGRTPYSGGGSDIIHRGMDNVSGRLALLTSDDDNITIRRKRENKGGHEVSWWINEEDQTQRTMQQTQQSLLRYLGILENNTAYYTDFLNTTYFSMDAVKAFAGKGSTSKERMDLISRFLNLEILDRSTGRSKVLSNNMKGEVDSTEGKLEFLSGKIDEDFSITKAESDISGLKVENKEHKTEIERHQKDLSTLSELKDLHTQLEDHNSGISRAEEFKSDQINSFNRQKKDLEGRLKTLQNIEGVIKDKETIINNSDIVAMRLLSSKFSTYLQDGRDKLSVLRTESEHLAIQIGTHLTCPKCQSELMMKDKQLEELDLPVLEKHFDVLIKDQERVAKQLDEKEEEGRELDEKISKLGIVQAELSQLYKRKSDIQSIPEKLKVLKEDHGTTLEKLDEQLGELAKKKLQVEMKIKKFGDADISLFDALTTSIDTLSTEIEENKDEIRRIESRIQTYKQDQADLVKLNTELKKLLDTRANYEFWVKGFPAIRTWMIEAFLPSFEEQTNAFLNQMEVGMRVRFDTQKEKKSGEGMKSQFDLSIIDSNNLKRELETYSGGETKRIGVCVGFALRELTLNKGYNAFNFLLMDEVIDSLDETGIGEFFDLLHNISGMKFLITHNTDLKNRFTNVIKITKEDGIATIKQ